MPKTSYFSYLLLSSLLSSLVHHGGMFARIKRIARCISWHQLISREKRSPLLIAMMTVSESRNQIPLQHIPNPNTPSSHMATISDTLSCLQKTRSLCSVPDFQYSTWVLIMSQNLKPGVTPDNRISIDRELHQKYAIRHPIGCGEPRLLISNDWRDTLRRLRYPALPTKLWVDALCITQGDDRERSR